MVGTVRESREDLPEKINLLRFINFVDEERGNRQSLTINAIQMEREKSTSTEALRAMLADLSRIQSYSNTLDIMADIRAKLGTIADCRTFLAEMKKRIIGQYKEMAQGILETFIRDAADFLGKTNVENLSRYRLLVLNVDGNNVQDEMFQLIRREQTRVREVLIGLLL